MNETAQSILESKAVAEESYPEQGKKNLTFFNAVFSMNVQKSIANLNICVQ